MFNLDYAPADSRRWAKNMRDLAEILGIPRATLQRWKNISPDDCPRPDAAGRWPVDEMRIWAESVRTRIEADSGSADDDDSSDLFGDDAGASLRDRLKRADLRYRVFRAKKSEREFHILEKKYLALDDVSAAWNRAASQIFQLAAAKISEELVRAGVEILEANRRGEEVMNAVFEEISADADAFAAATEPAPAPENAPEKISN